MSPKLMPKFLRLSFLSKLSQLVFLQIIFVFGALAIVLFYPNPTQEMADQTEVIEERLKNTSKRIGAVIRLNWSIDEPNDFSPELQRIIGDLLNNDKWITKADIFLTNPANQHKLAFSYDSPWEKSKKLNIKAPGSIISGSEHNEIVGPILSGENYMVYYYPFPISSIRDGVIGVAVNHNLILSNKDQMKHALLLIFLGATLLSLLTVYLAMKWFRDPLKKLLQRVSKTAEGGIYYQLEADDEEEDAGKLTKAFNEMSAQLYDNQQEIKEYHDQLNETNRSLITSKRFLSAIINYAPNALIVGSEDGQILIFSKEAIKTFGFDSDREIIGRDIQELFAQSVFDLVGNCRKDQKGTEALCWRSNKTMFPAFVTIAPIEIGEGSNTAYLYIVRDITDSTAFQQMMIRLNKNYTKGEMAGDIAHDINNYLAILMGNIELIPMFLAKNQSEKVDKKLEQMKNTLEKISNYTAGLMDSENEEVTLEKTYINQIIENILAFIRPQKRYSGINITTELSAEIEAVDADSAKIQQLIVNLLSNACDAVSKNEGGKNVVIKTSQNDKTKSVKVEVCDNGPGLHEDKREQLFQKRFTTKRKGHGIGLITCRKIIDVHHGKIGCEFGDETVFYFELPLEQSETQGIEIQAENVETVNPTA